MVAERTERVDWAAIRQWTCQHVNRGGRPCPAWGLDVERVPDGRRLCPRHRKAVGLAVVTPTCRNGHPRTPQTTYHYPDGKRECRTCRREAVRRWRQENPPPPRPRPVRHPLLARNRAALLTAPQAPARPETTLTPLSAPNAAVRASEGPLTAFQKIALEHMQRQMAAKVAPRSSFVDLQQRGEAERRRRAEERFAALERTPTPGDVLAATAAAFGVEVADLTGKGRHSEFSWPRQLTFYAMRQWCGETATFSEIGRLCGGRDHTTVLYGVEKIARLVVAGDREALHDLAELRAALVEALT